MRRNRELGQALVAVALGLIVLLSVLGLGIDFGYLRYMKRQMQTAADAAAVAGAGELDFGDSSSAAQAAASKNGFTNGSNGVTVTVNNPPSSLGAKDPNNGKSAYVEVLISQNQPTFFAKAFGVKSVPMTTRAEGAEGGGGSCTFALDPSGSGALTLFLAGFSSPCGVVDESSSSDAFQCIFAAFQAPYIGVVGGDFPFCWFPEASPTTGITDPSPTDPLAYRQSAMEAAAPSTCGVSTSSPYFGKASQLTINSTVILNPGKYCGGIVINPGANVTFNPGIYTLSSTSGSNGGLTIGVGTTVNGSGGVAFYNAGPNGGIDFVCSSCTAGNVTLTAPTSGAFEGVLFFQNPTDTAPAVVFGSTTFNTVITGTSYFPSAPITFAFDLQPLSYNGYNDIVAKDITIGLTLNGSPLGSTNIYNNYSTLSSGNPFKNGTGVLVE